MNKTRLEMLLDQAEAKVNERAKISISPTGQFVGLPITEALEEAVSFLRENGVVVNGYTTTTTMKLVFDPGDEVRISESIIFDPESTHEQRSELLRKASVEFKSKYGEQPRFEIKVAVVFNVDRSNIVE